MSILNDISENLQRGKAKVVKLRKSEYMRFRPSLFFRRLSEIAEKYCPRSVPRSSDRKSVV